MEPWQKGAPAVKKMTKGAQASYFKRFPDREDWFRQNHPDMAHFDTSVKQASVQKVDKAKMAERKRLSDLSVGATRGTATGGEGGNADAPPRDTIAPLTRDQHSAIQAAKKAAEPPKPQKPEKKPAAPKPLTQAERIAAIARFARKAQSPAKHDVPTFDPDDKDHDDYARAHYGMHQYTEEVELEEGKMKSAAADRDDDKGHEDFEATLSHAVKMAKGVAFDKRYKGGNMTGAVRAIRAIGKKYGMHELENHPEVSSALRRANEELEINEMDSEGYKGHRDDEDSGEGPEKLAKRVTKKQAAKDALKILTDRVRSSRESTNEEVEYIEERLSKSDPASTWISHFVSSENPMFSGKTKKERINMALGAYYKAKRAAPKNEEVEIDESKHEGRTPESPEETELAKHHGNPNKITYGDVVKARIASAKRKKSED